MDTEKKKQLSLGVIFSYLAIAAKLVSSIVYTPIILHSLGQNEYGVYSLCISFTGYLTLLNGGVNAAYVRYYVQIQTKDSYDINKLNGMFLKITLFLGSLGMFIGYIMAVNAEYVFGNKILTAEYDILKQSFYVLALTIFVYSLNGLFSSMVIANEKFVVCKLVELINTIITPLITVPFLFRGYSSVTILKISLGTAAIALGFNAIYSLKMIGMKFQFGKIDRLLLKSIIAFVGFIAIQGLMDQLNWQIDKFILAYLKGAGQVAVYSVGSTFNGYFITIVYAMPGVFIAEINRMAASGKHRELSDLFVRTSRIFAQAAFFVMSSFILFGKPFIFRWAGPEYGDSFYVGLLIMLPVSFSLTQGLGQDIARAKNLHKVQIMINGTVCVFNFLLSIPLAKAYGAIGSAFGTFICEIIICIVVQSIYFHKVVRIDIKAYFKEMLRLVPGWIIPVLSGVVIHCLKVVHNNYASIIFYGLIYLTIFFASIYMFSLSASEKELLKKIHRR